MIIPERDDDWKQAINSVAKEYENKVISKDLLYKLSNDRMLTKRHRMTTREFGKALVLIKDFKRFTHTNHNGLTEYIFVKWRSEKVKNIFVSD